MSRWAIACLVAAGCGSHPNAEIDASGDGAGTIDGDGSGSNLFDAAIDVPNVKGTVFVQVTNAATALCSTGGGIANLYVLFMDTDGTVTQTTTDTSGNAQGDVFPGASVTAMCHRSLGPCAAVGANCSYTMVTVLSVEPGDHLVLNADAFLTGHQTADVTAAGNFTVKYAAYAGAAGYDVFHPCGKGSAASAGATQITFATQNGCKLSTMDLVVVANNGGGNPLAYTEATNIAFTSGGMTMISDTWHAIAPVMATYSNPTAKVGNVELDRFVPDLLVRLPAGSGTLRTSTTMDTGGGTINLSLNSPLSAKAVMQSILSECAIADMNCSKTGAETITQTVDASATYALDIGAKTLPWLGTTGYDPATTTVTVPVSGTGAFDIFEADLYYIRSNAIIHIWRVFGPNIMDIHFASLPALPGGESPIPCPGTSCTDVQQNHHARIGESDAIFGYRPARQNVFDSLETCEQSQSPTAKRYPGTFNRFMRSQ